MAKQHHHPHHRGHHKGNVPMIGPNNKMDMHKVHEFADRQEYMKGFNFNVNAGTVTEQPIQLGGQARMLRGLVVFNPNANLTDEDTFSLVVNNELLIDSSVWFAFNPSGLYGNTVKEAQYFPLPRPLNGNDDVKINYNSINSHTVHFVFYLVNNPN